MYSVLKFQAPFERIKNYNDSAEVCLNKAIIIQAIIDASYKNDNIKNKNAEEAREWLFNDSDKFINICCNANLSTDFVKKIAKDAICINNYKQLQKSNEKNFLKTDEVFCS